MLIKAASVVMTVVMLASCGQVKNIAYFQDKALDHPEEIDRHGGIVIQPKDMISIVVSSRNPELASMFNLPVVSYQAGSEIVTSGAQQRLLGYVVDNEGYIDFPVIGRIEVGGMTQGFGSRRGHASRNIHHRGRQGDGAPGPESCR